MPVRLSEYLYGFLSCCRRRCGCPCSAACRAPSIAETHSGEPLRLRLRPLRWGRDAGALPIGYAGSSTYLPYLPYLPS